MRSSRVISEEWLVGSRGGKEGISDGSDGSSQHAGVALHVRAAALFALGPALDGNGDGGPRHEESRQTHGNSEGEHGVEIVGFECRDSVFIAKHECEAA